MYGFEEQTELNTWLSGTKYISCLLDNSSSYYILKDSYEKKVDSFVTQPFWKMTVLIRFITISHEVVSGSVNPDRILRNFRASKVVDQWNWWSQEPSIYRFFTLKSWNFRGRDTCTYEHKVGHWYIYIRDVIYSLICFSHYSTASTS